LLVALAAFASGVLAIAAWLSGAEAPVRGWGLLIGDHFVVTVMALMLWGRAGA